MHERDDSCVRVGSFEITELLPPFLEAFEEVDVRGRQFLSQLFVHVLPYRVMENGVSDCAHALEREGTNVADFHLNLPFSSGISLTPIFLKAVMSPRGSTLTNLSVHGEYRRQSSGIPTLYFRQCAFAAVFFFSPVYPSL